MAFDPDRRTMSPSQASAAEIDTGLRSYMLRVYNYMCLGVAFTAAITMFIASDVALVQTVYSLKWVFFIGILGMGFFAHRIMGKSVFAAQAAFWVYAALWGALMSPMIYMVGLNDPMMIVKAFLITSATFASMSLFGYTTKKNLGPMGAFLCMATFGLIIAMLVNVFFFQDTGMSLIISIGVVLVFSGLTAWETQTIKNMYHVGDAGDVATQKAIFGAFQLYGSFVVMFIHILNIMNIMGGDD